MNKILVFRTFLLAGSVVYN